MIQRTVKIMLDLTKEQINLIEKTYLKFGEIYNEYAEWYTSNKTTNKIAANKAVYYSHNKCGLPTALIQSARDSASESIKSYNTRFKKKAWTKTPEYHAKSARYNLRSMNLRGNLLTFSTLDKRIKTLIELPEWFMSKREGKKTLQAGRIGIDRNGFPYALLTFKIENLVSERSIGKIVGVDRGIYHLAYSSEGVSYSGKKVRAHRRRWLYNRSELQKNGTISSKRKLTSMGGIEKRYVRDLNHKISKALVSIPDLQCLVLEDLAGLAKKPKQKWAKHANKRLCDWSHAELLRFIQYKAVEVGVRVLLVDPMFTSQDCSHCKARPQGARHRGLFSCGMCGFKAHSDFNAAVNIRDRGLVKLSTS